MKISNRIRTFFKTPSLLKELVLAFTIVCLFITTLGYIIYYNTILNMLQGRQETETIQQFKQLDININKFFSSIGSTSEILLNNLSNQNRAYPYQDKISQLTNLSSYTDNNAVSLLNDINGNLEQAIANNNQINSIFIYTNSGDIIGGTDSLTKDLLNTDKSDFVYQSHIYDLALKNYPKMLWLGGNSLEDLGGFSKNELNSSSADMITAVRGFKSVFTGDINGILMFNINEEELTNSYKYLFEGGKGNAYIVDTTGKVISGSNSSLLGKTSNAFTQLKSERVQSESGSFFWKNGSVDENVFYYNIKSTGWMLFYEVPYSQYNSDIYALQKNTMLILFLTLILIVLISYILFQKIVKPLNTLTSAMTKLGNGRLGMTVENTYHNEFGLLTDRFNQMSENIELLVKEKEDIEKEKRRQEIATLQAQINPHFIFNTINTIKWMAVLANAQNIVDSLVVFSNLLKPLFKFRHDYYTIREEIEYINNYVRLLNYRYGDVLALYTDIPSELLEYMIPRFILQPLIENAVEHGMNYENGQYFISVTVAATDENICISVEDTGQGISIDELEEIRKKLNFPSYNEDKVPKHIGLENINHRIKLYYGQKYGVVIDSEEGKGTVVSIIMPLQK